MGWNGDVYVQSEWTGGSGGWMVWELIGRHSVEHAAEVWWSKGRVHAEKLKSVQMKWIEIAVGKK